MVRRARQVALDLSVHPDRRASQARPVRQDRKVSRAQRDPLVPKAMLDRLGPLVRPDLRAKPVQRDQQAPKAKLGA